MPYIYAILHLVYVPYISYNEINKTNTPASKRREAVGMVDTIGSAARVARAECKGGKRMKVREPFTREEIAAEYDKYIAAQAKQWGEDYIYTRWARESKAKRLKEYDSGKVVEVYSEECHRDGMDYVDRYYSDGTVDTSNYGYSD